MSEFGEELIRSAREAAAIARAELEPARTWRIPVTARGAKIAAPQRYGAARIRKLRGAMGLSQAVFADALNLSREMVRAWEQGQRKPEGATLRLLEVAERNPQVVLGAVAPKERDSDC
jgi:DNA-binding transcriptional regulator YiaG